ncbi:hypothetical protein [Arthrobacter sp. ISL-65]|uniref:hypothetical protein n=1 Tax=Arthrobacter sp. ISL-65 TaxID=2819112 RepID=UPI001BE79801|nr:hypothetical protein [Arthrobacter sp. ISL-65]MBT2551275.1 hypothetical protein [Arthrobacter sp. ISL-65]
MEMDIRGNWDRLSPSTQQWLTDNPGSAILPRTMAAVICKEIGKPADRDLHGGSLLSQEDRDFILDKAGSATSAGSGPRFSAPASTPRTQESGA